jgi:hypothetical protein
MANWTEWLAGGPTSSTRMSEELARHLRFRDPKTVRSEVVDYLSHLTQKSGALLAAQAIFIVVETYGIDHGWPKIVVIVSVLALVVAVLIVLTNLRSVYFSPVSSDDPTEFETGSLKLATEVLTSRSARFNVALYLTFFSVILLGIGAIDATFGL